MTEIVFVFRDDTKGKNDEDVVRYTDLDRVWYSADGHHFLWNFIFQGDCVHGFHIEELPEEITSILTREDFKVLDQFNKEADALGMLIHEDTEQYQRALELVASLQPIFDKLRSEENKKLFEQVEAGEREYLKQKYSLDDADLDLILENTGCKDRDAVDRIFDNIETAAESEARDVGTLNDENERYFNLKLYGEDMLDGGDYVKLSDGRVAHLV